MWVKKTKRGSKRSLFCLNRKADDRGERKENRVQKAEVGSQRAEGI